MTTDDGLLSQDEIDALTAGLGLGSKKASPPQETAVDDGLEVLRPLVRMICEQASSVVTTVLSRTVDIHLENILGAAAFQMPEELASNSLSLRVGVRKELPGTIDAIFTKGDVAILADLMLMGSGSADYSDEHKDAMQEIINQVMGSLTTTISSELGVSVEMSQCEVNDFHPAQIGGGAVADCALKVEGFPNTRVAWLFDDRLVESVKSRLKKEKLDSTMSFSSNVDPMGSLGLSEPSRPASQPMVQMRSEGGNPFGSTGNKALDLLMDIELPISIELGRTQMSLKRILELGPGAIVEMDRFAGEPVDLLINGKVVARGEVVVVDENFGVRIVSLVTPEERIKLLR